MKKANPPSCELALEQLDEVVGGSSTAPMGLGSSTPTTPYVRTARSAMPVFELSLSAAAIAPEPTASPMGNGGSPMGLGCSPMGNGGSTEPAPASHATPEYATADQIDVHEDLVAMTVDDAGAPQGLGGNR